MQELIAVQTGMSIEPLCAIILRAEGIIVIAQICFSVVDRQGDDKSRALSRFAFRINTAVVLSNNAVSDG